MMGSEEKAQMGAAGAEILKMLQARGFDTHQSCRTLLAIAAVLVAEGCRGDKVCLNDTLDRFSQTLRELAVDAFGKPKNVTASKMAFDTNVKESRDLVERMLKEEENDGYSPMMVKLPVKRGCRVCSSKDGMFRTTVVRKRLLDRSVTLWAVVTLCEGCLGHRFAQARLLDMLTEG
jgi:hypothetical protein